MNDQVLGACSLCGGRVTVPQVWWGVVPPEPTCSQCGAVPKLPTMEMEHRRPQHTGTTSNTIDITAWRR